MMSSAILEPDRDAHQVARHAGGRQRIVGQLLVRGARRVDHQRADVADVGQMAAQLKGLDEERHRPGDPP